MSNYQLPLSLLIAIAAPLLALQYLRGILMQTLSALCPEKGNAEFWWRVVNVLALSGSLVLMLCFAETAAAASFTEVLRRSMLIATVSVFFSVALVARTIWKQVQTWLARAHAAEVKPLVQS